MGKAARFLVLACSLAIVAVARPGGVAGATAGNCEEQGQYDACMMGVNATYGYCLQQFPGDPEYFCFGQRAAGEATCWAEYCFVLPDQG
jgi:hypothetical protein